MKNRKLTLVEVMIVVGLIALILGMFSGDMFKMSDMEKINLTARKLEAIQLGIRMYKLNSGGSLPQNAGLGKDPNEKDDSRVSLSDFVLDMDFTKEPPVGGSWKYHTSGGNSDPNIYVQIFKPDLTTEMMELLDSKIDDGDLNSGAFTGQGNHYDFLVVQSSKKTGGSSNKGNSKK